MLSPSQIGRFITNEDYRRLVDRLLSNGRCHSRRAQAVLHVQESLEVAAIGLGLQRICELAYWPVPEGADLAHRLLRLQPRDGLFGPPHSMPNAAPIIAASAVALRGLIEWNGAFEHREDERPLLERSIDRGLRALASVWSGAATSRELVPWAIVLWQLGDSEQALATLPAKWIRSAVAAADPGLLHDDLTRLALTMAA